jgi:alkylation response protein AidB-like acyl-CoA dehydrogenase
MATKRERVRAFMEEHVYPNERALTAEDEAADALIAELQQKAKDAGLWAPHLPPEAGGSGAGFLEYADLNEEIGRSFIAQLVFGCQAPDAGNGEILHMYGTDEQRKSFLDPLVRGEVRSFFGMTEPEVAGSDPTLLRGKAVRDGDEWVIDAHKWFSSGADGAAFGVVMVVTEPDAEPHKRASMILVPTDTPGYELVRRVPVMGHEGRGWGTHCETRFTGVRVPLANTLGESGDGFRIAQKRLGPGRIHHVMRWLGQMQRAFELMCTYALEREAHGGPLADKQTVQNWIAESAAEIQACRLMTMQAAQRIDEGDEARVEVSLIKFYAARVLQDVSTVRSRCTAGSGSPTTRRSRSMWRWRAAARIYDGPDEVHKAVVARRILSSFSKGDRGASRSARGRRVRLEPLEPRHEDRSGRVAQDRAHWAA